jgi:AcrR family transcriptional regulator
MTQATGDYWIEGVPADPSVREQLIAAAGEHFSKYGYAKTSLSDLAKAIGFSKTYFYRFFRSKQEIGEAICSQCLNKIVHEVEEQLAGAASATEKLRRMIRTVPRMSAGLFFEERKLYDLSATSFTDRWDSSIRHSNRLAEILTEIIREGREKGEFERKTPLDETVRAIMLAIRPFTDPRLLQYSLDLLPEGSNEVAGLILRSLAP